MSCVTEFSGQVLDNTMGALFIGAVLCMALWGAGSLQMYYYYNSFNADGLWLRLYVFVLWVLDTMHQAFFVHLCYSYLVTHYSAPSFLNNLASSLKDMVMVTAVIVIAVQSFFVYRIWCLSGKNMILTGTLAAICFVPFVLTILYFARMYNLLTFVQLSSMHPLTKAFGVASAAADALVAGTFIFLLQRSRTGFKNSETIINKLIMFTVSTGVLTGVCAIASLVSVSVWPNTFIYITFFFLVPRLYINSIYATLNARSALRGAMSEKNTVPSFILSDNLRHQCNGANGFVLDKSNASGQIVSIMVSKSIQDDTSKTTPSNNFSDVTFAVSAV